MRIPGISPASALRWAAITAAAAVVVTIAESVLLQARLNFFSGGFLANDYAGSTMSATAFLLVSFLSDACLLFAIIGIALWVAGRMRLSSRGASAASFVIAVVPVLAVDFISYRLNEFLGDALNVAVMFRLTGNSPGELLAASFPQLPLAILGIVLVAVGASWLLWITVKWIWSPSPAIPRVPMARVALLSGLVLLTGMVATTFARTDNSVLDNGLRRKPSGQVLGWGVQLLTDFDGDGYGALGRPSDTSLFDARIHPYALDVPGNGIDEDGVAGDLPVGAPYTEQLPPPGPWPTHPNVVLILLESVRADALGATYKGHAVTPVMSALAARGVSVRAYSHNGFTTESRYHTFTGSVAGLQAWSLVDDFKLNGYETAYFSAQDESFGGPAEDVGFARADVHFDARVVPDSRVSTFTTAGSLALPWEVLEQQVSRFLDTRRTDRPLFLYVNYQDTHFPYTHGGIEARLPAPVLSRAQIEPDRRDDLRGMYLNSVANVDASIGRILAKVRATLGVDPAVLVLSDHGESLFDEGFLGHGYALNEAQTRIPLIAANLPARFEEPVGQSDLRGIIRDALSRAVGSAAVPQVRQDPGRQVFQYLGLIDHPSAIGLVSIGGRTTYDFRSNRVTTDDGRTWRRPGRLQGAELNSFRHLVQTWERMMLARRAAGR